MQQTNILNQNKSARIAGLDYLKVLAVFFVIMLHLNGYVEESKGIANYTFSSSVLYYLFEAIAYPAIHLFVLIGSYFMVQKAPKFKSIVVLYVQMFLVTVIGLIAVLIFRRQDVTLTGALTCILPFSQRAYWFVSDYIVLMLLSPFLNIVLNKITTKQHLGLIAILFAVNSVLPYLSIVSWERSNFLLFVLLYTIAAYVFKAKDKMSAHPNRYIFIYFLSVAVLVLSALASKMLSSRIGFLAGKESFLYQYTSPVVILEGFALFSFFLLKSKNNGKQNMFVKWVCNASLLVYMLHMHPIVKTFYTKYHLLDFVPVDSGILFFVIFLLTVTVVFIVGTIVGNFIFKPVSLKLSDLIMKAVDSVKEKFKKKVPEKNN